MGLNISALYTATGGGGGVGGVNLAHAAAVFHAVIRLEEQSWRENWSCETCYVIPHHPQISAFDSVDVPAEHASHFLLDPALLRFYPYLPREQFGQRNGLCQQCTARWRRFYHVT